MSLKEAQRYAVEGDDGRMVELVELARSTLEGREFVLLASEADLSSVRRGPWGEPQPAESGGPTDDMDVYAFALGPAGLDNIDDEAQADRILDHFADLLGW